MAFRFERRLPWFALAAAWCALIFCVTLFPLPIDLRALANADPGAWQVRLLERLLNVVLFVPLGYVLASFDSRGPWRAIVIAAVLSSGIELTQIFISTRNPDVLDALTNTLGASLGALLTRWPLPAAGSWFWRAAFVVWIVAILLPMVPVTRTLYLAGWDGGYDVTLGDEFGGGRKYRGRVDYGIICVGRGQDEECREILGPTDIEPGFAELAESSQRFRLDVAATSESREQAGPARLITWSRDYTNRNVTLGQSNQDGIIRARTLGSSANGTEPAFRFPNAFEGITPGDSFTASAVWDRGRLALSVKGSAWEYSREIALGPARLLSLRSEPEYYVRPRESVFGDQIAAAIVALPTGFAAAGLVASMWLGIVTVPLIITLSFLWAPNLLAGIVAPAMLWAAPSFLIFAVLGWVLARTTIFAGTSPADVIA